MKATLQLILALLILAAGAVYVWVIDAPERWLTPGTVELSANGMRVTLTNISDEPVTVNQLGFAWKVGRYKYHTLMFDDQPRKILPRETYIETNSLMDVVAYLPAIQAAEQHSLALTIHVDGERKGGIKKFNRLPVILHDSTPRD